MLKILEGIRPDLKDVPSNPGCYIYKDSENNIIYIGKAKNLKNRIRSYFSGSDHSIKTQHLVSRIRNIEWIIVDNEIEALLLENNLIKKHRPRYNIDLKDNKRFAYIKITDEKFPRILTTRKVTKDGTYFGPYTDGFQRVMLIKTAVSIFKLRTCQMMPKAACLNFHIGICTAPCIKNVDENKYDEQVKGAIAFLKGDIENTKKILNEEMAKASKELRFEKSLEIRNQLEAIGTIYERQKVELVKNFDQDIIAMLQYNDEAIFEIFTISKGLISGKSEFRIEYSENVFEEFLKRYYSTRKIPYEIIINKDIEDRINIEEYFSRLRNGKTIITLPERGEKHALIELALKNALINLEENKTLIELKDALNIPQYPKVIECFDISNLGYEHVVAGMTRFVDGKPDKSGYRKFLIRSLKEKQDDFKAISEAVYRRYKRLKDERTGYPDLILIDGGPGQLNAAIASLRHLGLKIPIISLAKENEEIYLPNEKTPLQFEKNSKMMLLLREIRDSVHTFVLSYNKKRREMKLREEFERL